tara:strand:+ start:757 stop:1869 length:1113 start_codon:yes stop_codon:yes gene_type:complete
MKLKTETGEILVLDEESQVWKGEGEDSDTSITVSEADELLEKGDLEMVADESEITEADSLEEADEPKGKPLKKKKIKVDGSGEVEVHEDDDEDDDDEADGDEADEDEDDEVEETKSAKAKKEEVEIKVDVEDDVKALFDGQDLTEDFKARTKLVFETAVKAKVKENLASIEKKMEAQLAEQTADQLADITEKLDGYLDYMVSEYIEENAQAIEHEQKNEILEGFVGGMQKLFADNYIEIPDERYNVVDEQAKEIESLKESLDAEMNKNVEAKGKLAEASAEKIFIEVTEELTETQKAKMQTLADGVEFDDAETFTEKLETLKKTYFPSESEKDEVVAEEGANGSSEVMTDAMKKIVASLSQTREQSILGA